MKRDDEDDGGWLHRPGLGSGRDHDRDQRYGGLPGVPGKGTLTERLPSAAPAAAAQSTVRASLGVIERILIWRPQLTTALSRADYAESARLSFEIRSALRRAEVGLADLERKDPLSSSRLADQIDHARGQLAVVQRELVMLLRAAPVLEAPGAGSAEAEAAWTRARGTANRDIDAGHAAGAPTWEAEVASMAPALGLSGVTVHTDAGARGVTDAKGARGVALDGAVYLHPDRVRPGTPEGREVLAHELVHLAQAQLPDGAGAGRGAAENEAAGLAAGLVRGAGRAAPRHHIDLSAPAADTDAGEVATDHDDGVDGDDVHAQTEGEHLKAHAKTRHAHTRHGQPTPDAKASTEQTGVPIVDRGTACESTGRAHSKGCFLTKDDRTRLLLALSHSVQAAMVSFHAACARVRLDLRTLVKSESGWGFLAELLFNSLSGGLIGAFGKALTRFKLSVVSRVFDDGALTVGGVQLPASVAKRFATLNVKRLTGVLTSVSKGLRATLKNAAHRSPNASENAADEEFLSLIEEGIAPLTNKLVLEAPVAMTDAEIAASVHAFQSEEHSIAAYEADLRDLIARFNAAQLDSIGDGKSNGVDHMSRRQAVHVVDPKSHATRIAIVEIFDKKFAGPIPTKLYDGKLVPWETTEFVSWVDGDLEDAAVKYQYAAMGTMPTIEAAGRTGIRQIDEWTESR